MVLGLSRRQAARQEESIPEDLIASIPLLTEAGEVEHTTFAIEHEEDSSVMPAPAPEETLQMPPPAEDPATPLSTGATLAQQLRYDLGEALARELDRGSEAITAAMGDLEARLAQAEADLAAARAEVEHERNARETAEKRLAAFKELALK